MAGSSARWTLYPGTERPTREEAAARPADSRRRPGARAAAACRAPPTAPGPVATTAGPLSGPPGLAAYLLAALLDVPEPPALGGIQHQVGAHRNGYRGSDDNQPDPWIDEQQDETDDDATDRDLHPTRHVASSGLGRGH